MTRHSSLTRRLTVLFAALSSVVLLALGLVIARSVEAHFEQQDLEVLKQEMARVRRALGTQGAGESNAPTPRPLAHDAGASEHGTEVIVYAPDGRPLFATSRARFGFERVASAAREAPLQPNVWTVASRSYRAIASELPLAANSGDGATATAAVAIDIAHHLTFMQSFRQTLWLFVVGAALMTGLLGWAAARRGLAPLRAMGRQAQVVTAQQLDRRLPADAVPQELAELAQSLNAMLARLEEAFERLSRFSSDIAHELRTPVSNIMTQTHVALSRARSADEYRAVLESNAEELEVMARMVSDMLLLAKADHGLTLVEREPVQLDSEVRDLFDFFDALAEEKQLRLLLRGKGQVKGDKGMLRRAFANLLSNAVRYAVAGSTVRVEIAEAPAGVSVCFENVGKPIPPEYLERIFDRFFRVDPARQSEGAGLGLAITKSIVVAHGGSIAATSDAAATRFTLSLPHRDRALP